MNLLMELRLKMSSDLIEPQLVLYVQLLYGNSISFLASTCLRVVALRSVMWIDYAFLFISLFAVYKSTKNTTKFWIKLVL